MKNRYRPALALFAVGIAGAGCARNTFEPPPPPGVTVAAPSQRDVTVYTEFSGRLEAFDEVDIQARVRGFLDAVHFEDGARVEAGQHLFTIEPDLYEAAVRSAEASLAQAKANRQLADATRQRMQQAARSGAVSELDLLTAEAELESADAAVQAAEADLASRRLDLSYTEVTTPVAGRIARRLVSVGNLVGAAGSTLLTRVVVADPLYVYFNVDERTVLDQLARKGRTAAAAMPEVLLELADGSRYPEPAQTDYIDPAFDPATGTAAARAVVPNAEDRLAPGMFARVLIPREIQGALLVPEAAIQRDLAGPYLLLVDAENRVSSAYVELGPRLGDERVISGGLKAEDRIIVRGIQRARPGIEVNPAAGAPATGSAEGD